MSRTLLIIDDDKNILEIIEELLKDKFEKIHFATSVDLAIKQIEANQFQLIILDINLDGRNGAEVVKFLLENPTNQNSATPFLISSGIINQSFISKNVNRFAGIILKPFDHNELSEMVDGIISGKPKVEEIIYDDLPVAPCVLPFTVPQLEAKVNKVMDSVRKNSKLKELFQSLKISRDGDNYMLEHVGMVINISTAIAIALEWSTDKTLEKFVYAAYLHDMAINDRPDLAKINNFQTLEDMKKTLSPTDYKLIFEHPNLAATKLEELHEIPRDVATIVRQHHENPKERGWPNKIGSAKLSPLSSIFITAHELTDFILANPNWSIEKFIMKYKLTVKGPHFNKILQALEKLK